MIKSLKSHHTSFMNSDVLIVLFFNWYDKWIETKLIQGKEKSFLRYANLIDFNLILYIGGSSNDTILR